MRWRGGKEAGQRAAAGETSQADIANIIALKEKMALLYSFMELSNGAGWQEVNYACQRSMDDYAAVGPHGVRSESLLNTGLLYLKSLREKALASMRATCSHTLMRAAEVLDLMDCVEVIMRTARERKETRMAHKRSDYTFTNSLLADKLLALHKETDGEIVVEWRNKRY